MKTLVIDTNCKIKEVDFVCENFSELYKKCGYRSCNNYVCIESVDIECGTLEFWGKKSKSGYLYFNRMLYGKCCIVLKNNNGIQELTIEEYNKNILKYLEGDCNDTGNDNDNDNDTDNDNNKVNNPEDEEQYEDCEDECEDENVDDEHGDKVDDDVPDDDGDNQEDDNGDIHDKESLDVDDPDEEEDISENENYADDEEDNLDDTNADKNKTSKNSKNSKNSRNSNIVKNSKNSKNSKNIVNNTNEHLFNVKVDMDNIMVNRNKIDIDELVSNELVAEEYIYTSDEDY